MQVLPRLRVLERRSRLPIAPLQCLVLLLALTFSQACTAKFVADYDPIIDEGVTELHKKTTAFLLRQQSQAGTSSGEYEGNLHWYNQCRVELASLLMRAQNTPQNRLTTEQFELLVDSFESVAEAHEAQGAMGLNEDLVAALRPMLDVHFGAILKLEIAKLRGLDPEDVKGDSDDQPE